VVGRVRRVTFYSQGTLPPNPMSAEWTTIYRQLIMKTRCYFRCPASNISWWRGSLASDRPTANQCGRTVGASVWIWRRGSIFLISKIRVAHVVPGCSLIIQRFCLTGTDQVRFWIIGTRANTNISPIDTFVGGHHQCGCICWVRTVDLTSCCGRGGNVCVVATGQSTTDQG